MWARSVRATDLERTCRLPGDELIAEPIGALTHAITIRRPTREVWPWLVQMGAGDRAGWYSYDFIDNGRQRSADRIVEGLQHIGVGTLVPAVPGATDGFHVLQFETGRSLVLGWRPASNALPIMTWAFVLAALHEDATRLVVRARAARGYPFYGLPPSIGMPFIRFGHFVMQRKQLLGIASRAEARHGAGDAHFDQVMPDVTTRRVGGNTMSAIAAQLAEGHVSPGFEAVREAFEDNFARRDELGGACCVYYRGEKVVDLWGGIRNRRTGEPWEPDTMVIVHSATKGLAAMTLAKAHSRGWLDYEERVSAYWPEFAQQGKERITVRQLLAHQAGLFAFDEPVDRSIVADLDRLAVVLARQKPAWEPGTRQAYHALTLGFYEGELLRRVDPMHRSLGRFFQDEIASPLGLDLYIRIPEEIPNARLATMTPPGPMKRLFGFPLRFTLEAVNPRSNIYRALMVNPGAGVCLDEHRIYARNLEVPSGGAVGTARAIAHAYGVFANGGRELGLRKETLDLLSDPAIPPTHGFHDECMKGEAQFSLGFMKPNAAWPFGSARAFGAPGAGGALGFADPSVGVGYAYVTSQMGTALTGDPRDVALRNALSNALRVREASSA